MIKLTKIDGKLEGLTIVRLAPSAYMVFGPEENSLAVACFGIADVPNVRKLWKEFLNDSSVNLPEEWSVRAMANVFEKWLHKPRTFVLKVKKKR